MESDHKKNNQTHRSSEMIDHEKTTIGYEKMLIDDEKTTIGREKKMTERKNDIDIDDSNRSIIDREMQWLASTVQARVEKLLADGENSEKTNDDFSIPEPPELNETDSHYSRFLTLCGLSIEERIVLLIALAPEIKPEVFDQFFMKKKDYCQE